MSETEGKSIQDLLELSDEQIEIARGKGTRCMEILSSEIEAGGDTAVPLLVIGSLLAAFADMTDEPAKFIMQGYVISRLFLEEHKTEELSR